MPGDFEARARNVPVFRPYLPRNEARLGALRYDITKVLRDIGYSEEATPHGMRSAFKVWCAEVAEVRDEVSEAALAHTIPEKVRAAYLRTDFWRNEKRL
jgi:hypothetical protein